jgi:excisionase family DNA binding protein
VSTTTVGDLLDRAEILARSLRAADADADAEISTTQWCSFDATAYRLLHELVGPERVGVREQILSHASLSRILDDYPSPLAAPNPQTTYNAKQAASHLGVSHSTVVADIRGHRLPATFDGRRYSIKATDLPTAADVQLADPASTNALDQLTCTLGLLADMVVAERSRTTPTPGFDPLRDDTQVAPVVARVFAITIVAARHALAHIPLQDADRPLTIAQYAEHSMDTLGDVDRPSGLNRVASFAPPSSPRTPNEELEAALRTWAGNARTELAKTIPSTEVLRDIANQARHLYAASARLAAASFTAGHLSEDAARAVHEELRQPAQIMHRLQQQWGTVTTATKPSHEYVTAATTLHASLTAIEREGPLPGNQVDPARQIDLDQALADLRYAATDLVELTHAAAQLPEPLIRSGLLFAPARILPSTMERLQHRNHGRYVPIELKEGAVLIEAARASAQAARNVHASLETYSAPLAGAEPTAQPLVGGSPFRDFEPSTDFSGPDVM